MDRADLTAARHSTRKWLQLPVFPPKQVTLRRLDELAAQHVEGLAGLIVCPVAGAVDHHIGAQAETMYSAPSARVNVKVTNWPLAV